MGDGNRAGGDGNADGGGTNGSRGGTNALTGDSNAGAGGVNGGGIPFPRDAVLDTVVGFVNSSGDITRALAGNKWIAARKFPTPALVSAKIILPRVAAFLAAARCFI